VCDVIDPQRCSRCFTGSALHAQMAAGRVTRFGRGTPLIRTGLFLRRVAPALANAVARTIDTPPIDAAEVRRRLAYARHVFDTIDLFVAPSASIGAEFVRLGIDPDRVEVSDYGFVRPEAAEISAGSGSGALRIGFVGTLVWHKGAHVLIEAVRLLQGAFEVHVHGDTTVFPEYVAGLRRAAAGLPVTFHGGFERRRVSEIYDGVDVLVVPSLWPENSPLVIHEAFMHRRAVVGFRIGGIDGLVVDGVNGLLAEAFSAESLAAALGRLLSDPALRRRLAAAAPPVKPMAQDAREWDARYARLRRADREAVAVPVT
jgi:glycosyltransferase involved in cell wall biosynthesis